jgi:hypothetical protein
MGRTLFFFQNAPTIDGSKSQTILCSPSHSFFIVYNTSEQSLILSHNTSLVSPSLGLNTHLASQIQSSKTQQLDSTASISYRSTQMKKKMEISQLALPHRAVWEKALEW